MEAIIQAIAQNPSNAIVVVALALACLFAYLLFMAFKEQVSDLKNSNQGFATKLDGHVETMNEKINDHKEAMGLANKALKGDLLIIQEKTLNLKESFMRQIEGLKNLARDTQVSTELANQTAEMAIKSLEQKLGRVILIEKTLEIYGSQLEKLQTRVGEFGTKQIKNDEWFSSISFALKAHKDQLSKLESMSKKGP